MTNPDGTLTEEEALPIIKEIINFLKDKNLSYTATLYVLKRTSRYMSENYKETKKLFNKGIEDKWRHD